MLLRYSIGLLLLMVLPFGGTYCWLQVQKKQARRAVKALVKQDMPLSTLTHLVLNDQQKAEDLDWIHEREFRYQGILFDIFWQEECQDGHHFWVWADQAETRFHQELRNWLAQQANLPVDPEATPLQFGKNWLCQQLLPLNGKFSTATVAAFWAHSLYSQTETAPPSPPPRG